MPLPSSCSTPPPIFTGTRPTTKSFPFSPSGPACSAGSHRRSSSTHASRPMPSSLRSTPKVSASLLCSGGARTRSSRSCTTPTGSASISPTTSASTPTPRSTKRRSLSGGTRAQSDRSSFAAMAIGDEKPTFLISNDFETPVELLVGHYARRWRIENSIAEAVKFFHLNALSSPILVKIHFDLALTMIADTLYTMLAPKPRGFEQCDAPKLYRHFIRGKGIVHVRKGSVTVTYPRRAHNPILRQVPWDNLPLQLPGLGHAPLRLIFS